MSKVNPTTADWDLSTDEEQLAMQLDSLESEPETAPIQSEVPSSDIDTEGVKFVSNVFLKGFELIAKKVAKNPYLKLPDEAGDALAEKLVPVLNKYDVGTPEFLDKWSEEIELGMVIAGIGYGLYQQHVAIQEQMIAKAKEVAANDGQGAESEQKAA